MMTSLTSNRRRTFRHAPLNHAQPSIRLIRIRPGLSMTDPVGLIRCKISHATVEAEYTCLSYRWGDEDPSTSKTILLNGELFTIRQNFYDFLYLVCTECEWLYVTERKYWIDALCINQSDCSERNHQVAQMSRIFASAQLVHVWLGSTSDSHRISTLLSSRYSGGIKHGEPHERQRNMQLIGKHVFHNEYWNRAWVVQEIILAQNVVVSLSTTTCSLFEFSRRVHLLHLDLTQTPFQQFDVYQQQDALQLLQNTSLLSLLGWFRDKDCAVPRDRVFSLLAMCHPNERIQVDYGNHWTDLVIQIIEKTTHLPCICSAALLTRSLMPSKLADVVHSNEPMLEFDITDVYLVEYNVYFGPYNFLWHTNLDLRIGFNGRDKERLKNNELVHRACLQSVLRILRDTLLPWAPYNLPQNSIKFNSKDTYKPPSLVKLFRAFLTSPFRESYSDQFERLTPTLLWFNFSPGWYMSAQEDQTDTVTVYVSMSALGKASEGIELCDWQGKKGHVSGDDLLFRHFSIFFPPKHRDVGIS